MKTMIDDLLNGRLAEGRARMTGHLKATAGAAAVGALLAFSGPVSAQQVPAQPAPAQEDLPAPIDAETASDAKIENTEETYRLLNLFGDVFERVRAQYVDRPSDEEIIEAAISGMLTSLDPHSSYLNARTFQEMRVNTRGEFGGLGIQVTLENGVVKVISPIDDTPAFHAGIKSGDLITHIDGEAVQGLTLSEAVEKMRGKVGSDIKVTVLRDREEPFDVTITRAVIKITSVRHRLEGDVGYVRVTAFNEQTTTGLTKAVKKIRDELGDKFAGLVLDLRNNPGGLLDEAVSVSDAFLDRGEIVSTRSRDPNDASRFNAKKGDLIDGKPLVVLINGGSASASEIVAGALQDHRRAVVLGTRSFGKGSVQTIIPLQGQRALRLTTALYYTPSGTSIQAKGINPDIEVQPARIETIDVSSRRREENLRGAISNGNEQDAETQDGQDTGAGSPPEDGAPDPSAATDAENTSAQDYQLQRAVDLIRGIALLAPDYASTTN